MLTYAIIIFAIAAVGGVVLATRVLTGQFAPWALSIAHAALGATGLIILIMMVLEGGEGRVTAALGLFIVAALGGFYLASLHAKKSLAPKNVVIIHASLAVAGFLTLLSLLLN